MNAEHDTMEATLDRPQRAEPSTPRASRPELQRTAPLRQASTLLRESVAATTRRPPKSPRARTAQGAPAADEDPVALGVRLGYQVIEEQILQGQKLAQRLGRQAVKAVAGATGRSKAADTHSGATAGATAAAAGGSGEAGDANPGDMNELIERVVDLYKDLGSLCVDAVETLARHPVVRAGVARMSPGTVPPAARAGVPAPQAAPAVCALDIRSSRRTQVTLDLRPGARVGDTAVLPRVHALHAADPATPPLSGVCFVLEAAATPVLRVHVADTQPAGLYTGVVVDSLSNEPCGTLTVRLLP